MTFRQFKRMKLKELRDLYELTHDDIAKILNIDNSLFAKYEKEYYIISTKYLTVYAIILMFHSIYLVKLIVLNILINRCFFTTQMS